MQRFFEIFSDGPYKNLDKLFDAKLRTEDGVTFQVHRMQLAMRNIYFKAMYCGSFSNSTDVLIKGIDGETLGQVLYYLYTNKAVLDRENVMDLWIASDYFLADSLKEMCKDFVLQELDEDNCLGVFLTVLKIEGLGLVEECLRYLMVHFQDVILDCFSYCRSSSERTSLDILKDLPFDALKNVLESKSLNVPDERIVWDAILTWLRNDNSNKHQHIPELLKCMYMEDLDELLATEIHEIVRNHFSLNIKSEISQCLLENFAHGSRSPKNLYFVAQHSMSGNNFYLDLYLTFDDRLDIWRKLGTNLALCPDFLVRIGYNIYMFDAWENRTMVFNLLDCSRSPMPPLSTNRLRYSVVSVLDYIYVLGGVMVDFDDTDIIERFDPVTNEWHIIPQMHPMILTDVVAMNNCIYAIGDIGVELNPSMMMQIFDPMTDQWHVVEAPKHFRHDFTAVVYKGKLYVIGGEDQDGTHLRTAEEYNPENDTWRLLSELPFSHVLPKAIVIGDLLVVYENHLENRRFANTSPPVFFEEESEKWVIIDESSPLFNVHLYQFCNISQPDIVKGLVRQNRLSGSEWVSSYLA